MASSDLTMQLLMASQQPQQQDPATAAAIPRLQLAQQLMQQGTDASPTSKWGGISRLAAALTGNYIFDKASTGLQDAYKDLAPQLASTLPEGHPLIKALNSPSPMVRFQATQAWQKMMPMLGGVDKLNPGQTPMVAGQPLAGPASGAYSPQGAQAADYRNNPAVGQQAAAVTAPIAGANKNAELPATIAAQNNEGNVESTVHMNAPAVLSPGQTRVAPTQQPMAGMTNLGPTQGNHLAPAFDPMTGQPMPNYPTTPNGPHAVPGYNPGHPTPPLPVNGAANPLLGPIPGQGAPLSPQDQKSIDAMLAHNPPLPANYKAPASVSAVPPMVTPPVPQPQAQPPAAALTSPYPPADMMGPRAKLFSETQASAAAARDEIQNATLLKNTLHQLGSTGPATPFLANLSRYAAQAGVSDETIQKYGLPPGGSEAQAAALANNLVMEIAKKEFPNRVTNADLQFAKTVKPNAAMPMAANDFLLDNTILPKAQRDIDRYGAVVNLQNPSHKDFDQSLGSIHSKLYDFDQSRPLTSYTPSLNKEGASPAAEPKPPVPGARMAADKNWYLPDPARPGKYLQVKP